MESQERKVRADGMQTREALLSAAADEFAGKGFALASAREICRSAGVNAALLSRYFGSKEALYRLVAKRLFGDLGAPLATLHEKVLDEASWRAAVREWIDDMLFMTLPTAKPQKLCAALFRHEVTRPTKFHKEFKDAFGRPVYEGLKKLLAMKVKDEERLELLTSSIWAQVSVYALADRKWHVDFRPKGAGVREWAEKVRDHICEQVYLATKNTKGIKKAALSMATIRRVAVATRMERKMTEIANAVKKHRPMLRNANINYSCGTFFVTMQAAFNKTIFGAIVGEKCVLNELGEAVAASFGALGEHYAGVEIDEFVVMPNHVHFIIRIGVAGLSPRHTDQNLGFVVGRFKSWISKLYRDMVAEGKAVDVGTTPWQRDFWEKLVTTPEQLEGYRRYIRENPAKWTRDRFGAVTSYTFGNIALLNAQLVGFVASQGAYTSELKPRRLWKRSGWQASAPAAYVGTEARHPESIEETGPCPREKPPLISTFTSAQERAVFAKALASGRRFVKVCPGGIPLESELEPAVAAACNEGRGLLISPAPSGTGVNKQRAVWCNEYILKNAAEAWAGDITPGHTLASLVAALMPQQKSTRSTRLNNREQQ